MIVNYTQYGWEVIMQRAHGLLAAQIAMQWQVKNRPQRWPATVVAIAGHDDAQTELDEDDLLTPQGGPVNFAMKLFEAGRCERMLHLALCRSRYTALLASMHMSFLYKKEMGSNPLVTPFLKEQEKRQSQWCKDLSMSQDEAKHIYGLLEWCDAFSLLLCQHEVQPEHRIIEISEGAGKQHILNRNSDGSLNVAPWPFEDDRFELSVETRLIPQLTFKTCAEFKKHFLAAEVTEKRWVLARQ